MALKPLTPELLDLMRKVAAYPHGLGFLREGDLRCVAVTLRVHPFVIDEARDCLQTPEGRALLVRELRRARSRIRREPPTTESLQAATDSKQPPADAEELIRLARTHAYGLRFLLQAPFETVAITFGVHPSLVFEARELAREHTVQRRGSRNPDRDRPA